MTPTPNLLSRTWSLKKIVFYPYPYGSFFHKGGEFPRNEQKYSRQKNPQNSICQFGGWGIDLSISMFQFIHSGWGVGVGATVAWVGASQVW